jgi:UDP-N-acetylglucosamine--N-acetylmuramyl-(pentapeptide) pyrophosphoryl-undecaprenol N-acetylglucosamine transferase
VVIAASGTGGHVIPALAVAEALEARGAEVSFVAPRGSGAAGLAARNGYDEDTLPLRGLDRRPSLRNVRTLVQAALAVPRAGRIIRRRHADVVIGAGGYMAAPVAFAARLRRRPVLLTEADSHLGVANRVAAPLAKRVALAFPLPGRGGPRYVVTGRPVRRAVRDATRTGGRRRLGIPPEATVVLVVGGSQGARSLNRAAVGAFGDGPPFELIHVAGPGQVEEVRAELATRAPGEHYRLEGFLDDLPAAMAAADLVVSRSGGSVFELAAIGRPSILVPYPHAAADHQAKNARWLAEAGGALVLPDEECTPTRLRELVGALLTDRQRLDAMGRAAAGVGRPDAADVIAEEALGIARRRRRRPRLRRPRRPRLRFPRVRRPRLPRLRRRRR